MFLTGDGVPESRSLAAHYFKLAADQGHPGPQYLLRTMLFDRDGIALNKSIAAHYFKLVAD
jgi:TPR repeat protein